MFRFLFPGGSFRVVGGWRFPFYKDGAALPFSAGLATYPHA